MRLFFLISHGTVISIPNLRYNRAPLRVCCELCGMSAARGAVELMTPVSHWLGHKMEALNNQGGRLTNICFYNDGHFRLGSSKSCDNL